MLTIGGIALVLVGILVSTVMDGNSFAPLVGPSAAVLVVLGAVGAGITSYEVPQLAAMPRSLARAFSAKVRTGDESVTRMMRLAEVARREGVLALESELETLDDDPFLRQALQLVVDGMDTENVRAILDTTADSVDARHQIQIGLWRTIGGYCPTFGMMGTIIGLVNMLGDLSDPSQLGTGMSLALLTTLYGVFFSNVVFVPVANKLERLNSSEMATMGIIIDGVLAIQAGASPRMLVERLEAFLEPTQRVGHHARAAGEAA